VWVEGGGVVTREDRETEGRVFGCSGRVVALWAEEKKAGHVW